LPFRNRHKDWVDGSSFRTPGQAFAERRGYSEGVWEWGGVFKTIYVPHEGGGGEKPKAERDSKGSRLPVESKRVKVSRDPEALGG